MTDTLPILCYVTDRHSLRIAPGENPIEALLEKIQAAATAGLDWIQIREKDLSGKDCAALAREALRCILQSAARGGHQTRILVNDRLDVAIAERAGGVHLGENSLPVREAKCLIAATSPGNKLKNSILVGV